MFGHWHKKSMVEKFGKSFLLLLIFLANFSFSQNQTKQWYFGLGAGLDFMTSPPTILNNSAMTSTLSFGGTSLNEGVSSVADASGNLLFYTDGVTIWNKVHQVMANGNGLFGHLSGTQSALIAKKPGSSMLYYVFTMGEATTFTTNFNYSIVDMSLATGMGSVTVKNHTLTSLLSTEKLAGAKHCNGTDIWIITHDYNTNIFRSLLLTSAGLSSNFTLSATGPSVTSIVNSVGEMKVSPTGKKIACAIYDFSSASQLELYDFDNVTGSVSNPLILPTKLAAYGCAFSPDGSKIYCSATTPTFTTTLDSILQWDLCAGSSSAILNSRYSIPSPSSGGMQNATDGKIYVAQTNMQGIGVINAPNLSGAACNYVSLGQSVAPGTCSYGLPNFIYEPNLTPFTFSTTPSISCNTATFSLPGLPTVTSSACTSTGYSVTNFVWYFGDPASGAANTSTLSNPSHFYTSQGIFTANLVYYYNNTCGGINTDTIKQEVPIGSLPIISSGGFFICAGQSLTLSSPGATTYSWSTGALTNTITVSPTVTTGYTVYSSDVYGCAYISHQTVIVNNYPVVSVSGQKTVCPGFQLNLTASGANSYSWSSGSTTPFFITTPTASATYTVYGSVNGCVNSKTVSVFVGRPAITISGSTIICPGQTTTLNASGLSSYLWSTGATNSVVVLSPTVTKTYTIQGANASGCTNSLVVTVTVTAEIPVTGFSYKSPVCEKTNALSSITVTGFESGGTFFSQDLEVDAVNGQVNISSVPAGTYVVYYTINASGCKATGNNSATLAILPAPVLTVSPDQLIPYNGSAQLSVKGATSYSWDPSDYLTCNNCENPVAQPPGNSEYCVSADLNGCVSKACVKIFVSCETNNDYSVPNAFTPNDDGNNDAFCLQGWSNCMSFFNVMIYNRWGEKIFESNDPDFCWDGKIKGIHLDSDVYVYVITAKKLNRTETLSKKGNISLIR